jgi:hypothetical protein
VVVRKVLWTYGVGAVFEEDLKSIFSWRGRIIGRNRVSRNSIVVKEFIIW